jgi:hypothetical protein
MKVLSLFDGMSCGQIALNNLGFKIDNYFAAEIKKHAIEVTQYNFPNTIQLGDVTKINVNDLPKIDLLIGGSPCQDFSRANSTRDGLQGQKSKLFFEYVRILNEIRIKNPNVKFLLENVVMSDYNYWFICNVLNCEPVRLCGSLTSAALRDRLYWTNIGPYSFDLTGRFISQIPQPKDKNIYLQDILTSGKADKRKHSCLNTSSGRGGSQRYLKHRNNTTGMITLIYEENDIVRTANQTELELMHNIPLGYTKILTQQKAGDLIGDGWTIGIIEHIFSYLKQF